MGGIGVRSLMWGSDYPLFDSTRPYSSAVLSDHFAGVPQEDQLMIAAPQRDRTVPSAAGALSRSVSLGALDKSLRQP
jgi:hypothetical protein